MSSTPRILNYLGRQSKLTLWSFTVLSLLSIWLLDQVLDYSAASQIEIAFLYLLPVSLASWSLGTGPGWGVALFSTILWQGNDLLTGQNFSTPLDVLWNTLVHLAVFLIFASLISELRLLLENQTELSRTDSLTGILNRRAFYEAADAELKKVKRFRRPLTVAFIDLDDFKAVNDTRGHKTGDALLCRVAERLKHQVRGTDYVARLGGDEYGILLPETNSAAAETVISHLQFALRDDIAQAKRPVTFSMGVLTCNAAPLDTEAVRNQWIDVLASCSSFFARVFEEKIQFYPVTSG